MTAERTDEVATDTGVVWTCPCCSRKYHLIHRQVGNKILKHDFEEVVGECPIKSSGARCQEASLR